MCLMATLRKVCCIVGTIAETTFFILSVAFHLPFIWYYSSAGIKMVGGLWTYCATTGTDWECDYVDKNVAEAWGHTWADYATMRTFVIGAEMFALATMVLFYVCTCFKATVLSILLLIGAAIQFGLILVASSLAQTAFTEVLGVETEADWGLYVIWLCWMNTIVNIGLAVGVLVAGCLDD